MKLIACSVLLCAALSHAVDVKLEWRENGASRVIGFYKPQALNLSDVRPADVAKLPEAAGGLRFGEIKAGPASAAQSFRVALEEVEGGNARLWVDANANGDFTDDPPVKWQGRKSRTKTGEAVIWGGSASLNVTYASGHHALSLELYRFGAGDPRQAKMKNVIFYYRDYAPSGRLTLGEKSYDALLSDDAVHGDFRGAEGKSSGVALLVDVNGDGKFSTKLEQFDVRKPFNIGGNSWQIEDMVADGLSFQLVPAKQAVAEKTVVPPLLAGSPAVPFKEKATTGNVIDFPSAYRGKLVMLDFWATWCGPCLEQLPELIAVYEEFHAQGFEIVGVSLDNDKTLPRLAKFLADRKMTWPQIADGLGWDSKLADLYDVHGIPAAWLVDGTTGQIVAERADLMGSQLRGTVERCLKNLGKRLPPPSADAARKPVAPAPKGQSEPDKIVLAVQGLGKEGKLMSADVFTARMAKPVPEKVSMKPTATAPLTGRQIAKLAEQAHVRAGWVYECSRCSNWHRALAGGYAIAADTIVTAHHVMDAPARMKPGKGYPIIVIGDDRIVGVTSVLAADKEADAIVIRVVGAGLTSLALSRDVQPGDRAFCWSDPLGRVGYFAAGIVNRVLPAQGRAGRLNVSTDWAQGSSGAAVLDECGNVIGHVSKIEALLNPSAQRPDGDERGTVLTVREAVSAAAVLDLIEPMIGVEAKQ